MCSSDLLSSPSGTAPLAQLASIPLSWASCSVSGLGWGRGDGVTKCSRWPRTFQVLSLKVLSPGKPLTPGKPEWGVCLAEPTPQVRGGPPSPGARRGPVRAVSSTPGPPSGGSLARGPLRGLRVSARQHVTLLPLLPAGQLPPGEGEQGPWGQGSGGGVSCVEARVAGRARQVASSARLA